MARFVSVVTWPNAGAPDKLMDWPAGPAKDALLRTGRAISELYSEPLPGLGYEGYRSTLFVFVREVPALSTGEVRVTVWPERPTDMGGEVSYIDFNPDITPFAVRPRAQFMLEAVHLAARRLCELRTWDPEALEACYQHVVNSDYEFRWASEWKASPSRRHIARAEYRLPPDDGWGYVRLRVRERGSSDDVGLSPEARAECSLAGFRLSAKTLSWSDAQTVGLDPYPSPYMGGKPAWIGGHIGEQVEFEVHQEITVLQPDEHWRVGERDAGVLPEFF